jgi:hypothetical protein
MKKNILLATAIVVVGLMITSAASSISIIETTNNENELVAHYLPVQCQPLAKTTYENSAKPLSFASVQISGGDYDEFRPSLAGAPGGEYYAMMEYSDDGATWLPAMYYSPDGVSWDLLLTGSYENVEYTDMDQNDHGTYGTSGAPPDNSGVILVLQGEIADGWVWDFASYDMNEFSNNRIACYTFEGPEGDPGEWNWGALAFTGYNGYGTNDIDGCPYVFYQEDAGGQGIIGWMTGASAGGCKHVGADIDLITNMKYNVYDRDTGTGNYDLLLRKDDMGDWTWNPTGGYYYHDLVTTKSVSDAANLMYPSVAAHDNNVIIACMKDNDVIVYYSANGFASYTELLVQDSASYPEVEIGGEGLAVITYIKDGTLYYRTSDTGGSSWSAAAVVSDSQVNLNDRAVQLDTHKGSVFGVWEDTRGANVDAYYDMIYEFINNAPLAPSITGPNQGTVNKPYIFTFKASDPDGNDVKYIIDWGDTTSNTTEFVAENTNFAVMHTWTSEGEFTITAKAQDVYGEIGPEATKTVTMPRNKISHTQLFLRFIENHQNLFPILRQLLGL